MKKYTNEELLKMKDSPSEHYDDVCYSYTEDTVCKVPQEVIDSEDDDLIADWIAQWENDAMDIQVTSY